MVYWFNGIIGVLSVRNLIPFVIELEILKKIMIWRHGHPTLDLPLPWLRASYIRAPIPVFAGKLCAC